MESPVERKTQGKEGGRVEAEGERCCSQGGSGTRRSVLLAFLPPTPTPSAHQSGPLSSSLMQRKGCLLPRLTQKLPWSHRSLELLYLRAEGEEHCQEEKPPQLHVAVRSLR